MKVIDQKITENYSIYNGDSCKILQGIPDNSIDYIVYSPPFFDLFNYTDSIHDISNSLNDLDFLTHYDYIIKETERILKPGRLISIHCMDTPYSKSKHGFMGLRDFPGEIIRMHQKYDMIYHSRHCIWKDPLIEAVRTKAIGLAHKQIVKDSSVCRSGLPDYIITMKKRGDNENFVSHKDGFCNLEYPGSNPPEFDKDDIKYSHNFWRRLASPVWMDVRQTKTLNYRAEKGEGDTKHMCPTQLDSIHRCLMLYSNPGDVVLSPFGGVGTEPYCALNLERKAIAIELKKEYFEQMKLNLSKFDDTDEFTFI